MATDLPTSCCAPPGRASATISRRRATRCSRTPIPPPRSCGPMAITFLTQNLGQAFDLALETKDPAYPQIHYFTHPTMKLGGDVCDFVYRQAWISGDHTYKITGRKGTARWFNLTVQGPKPAKVPGTDYPPLHEPFGDTPERNILGSPDRDRRGRQFRTLHRRAGARAELAAHHARQPQAVHPRSLRRLVREADNAHHRACRHGQPQTGRHRRTHGRGDAVGGRLRHRHHARLAGPSLGDIGRRLRSEPAQCLPRRQERQQCRRRQARADGGEHGLAAGGRTKR